VCLVGVCVVSLGVAGGEGLEGVWGGVVGVGAVISRVCFDAAETQEASACAEDRSLVL